jgi:hypothetical protein
MVITTLGPRLFAPMLDVFMDALRNEGAMIDASALPWQRTDEVDEFREVLRAAGITNVGVTTATTSVPIDGPDDWWSLVEGTGLRRLVADLGVGPSGRVRKWCARWISTHNVTSVSMTGCHYRSTGEMQHMPDP